MATKQKQKQKTKTYTVRIEWPVTYYCDTIVKASSIEEAARLALEDPDYDNPRSYDESGESTVEGVCEGEDYRYEDRVEVGGDGRDDEPADNRRSEGWDVFDVCGREMVQAEDDPPEGVEKITDDRAIELARAAGIVCDDDGYLITPVAALLAAAEAAVLRSIERQEAGEAGVMDDDVFTALSAAIHRYRAGGAA
jgi:hypothetical protein